MLLTAFTFIATAAVTCGSTFRAPIARLPREATLPSDFEAHSFLSPGQHPRNKFKNVQTNSNYLQKSLGQSNADDEGHGLPTGDFWNLIYTANLSVGTPGQSFRLAITTADDILTIPSANCKYFCADPTNQYNSSLSSTYKANGSYLSTMFSEVNYGGVLSYESVHIGDLELQGMAFEEWTDALCVSIGCFELGYDGVFGLAPPWSKQRSIPAPLAAMLDQGVLDEPIFSLKLPRSEDEEGDLLFGASDPSLYKEPLISLPALDSPEDSLYHDLWFTPIDHVTFNSQKPMSQTFNSSPLAILDSSTPYLILESEIARNLSAAIGAQPGPLWFSNVPCSQRLYLPTLTIGLSGHNFTIDAFDYTLEVYNKGVGSICLTTFWAVDEFWGDSEDFMLLGAPFMRGVYSVFDMEKREIQLAQLNR